MAREERAVDRAGGEGREDTCHLCGLPLGRVATGCFGSEDRYHFCCPGCREVFKLLSSASGDLPANFRDSELYQACVAAGIIPGGRLDPSWAPAGEIFPGAGSDRDTLELTFRAEGMWCPSCAWLIEEVLKRTPGVLQPRVSFFSDIVRLQYLPHLTSPVEIISRIEKLGYRTSRSGEDKDRTKSDLLIRLGISAILTMNTMMLSWALYSGFVHGLSPTVVAYLSYPLFLMAVPVVFYGGMPIFRKAWGGLRFGSTSMDTLIAISALAAFCYSVIGMARNSIHLYFDTATMLITVVLLGRYVEIHTRERVSSAFREMDEMGRQKVRLAGATQGTPELWVAAEAVRPGDHFIVRENERVSLDGRVVDGKGLLDQSALTGETKVVARGVEDGVMAGSLLVEGKLEIVATWGARESSLRRMVDLMMEALDRKNEREQLVDSVSRMFVPAILTMAAIAGSALWFYGYTANEILLRCLTILLISCPCALGIAVPLGKVAMIGLGRTRGILVRNHEALEQVRGLDTLVLDKTGTVTEGAFALRCIVCHEVNERTAFSIIAAIEKESFHFIAREIVRHARKLGIAEEGGHGIQELEGLGVTGVVAGKTAFIGNRRLLSLHGAQPCGFLEDKAREQEQTGMTVVFFGWDGEAKGFLVFGDPIRHDALELIHWLQRRRIKAVLLSGDGEKTTEAVARSLGIRDFYGQRLPSDKVELIRDLQHRGHKTGMVGDGVNDAGALAQADVSFAMGSGYNVTKEASDLMIPSGRLAAIADAFDLSERSVRMVRQNLFLAFFYNVTAIPVAAAGLLSPLVAVCAMFMNSLTVIGNTLRISGRKYQRGE
ncbi:MAG: Copper-exporting P-type ATPase A [Syntrophorhabdus sp. PtaU1.Bin153]|nr:MAG: Copper-exporting P-type ATPase A [Syntrophorhabdus sp. PtaU1.Bin153]